MTEELFEKYLQHDLDESGIRRLGEVLATEEGARDFAEFVQEWTLLGEAAQKRLGELERKSSQKIRKIVPRPEPSRAWIGWVAGLAAAVLIMVGLVLNLGGPERTSAHRPVATAPPEERTPEPPPVVAEKPPRIPPEPERPAPTPPAPPTARPEPVPPAPKPEPEPPPKVAPVVERPPETVTRTGIAEVARIQGEATLLTAQGRSELKMGQSLQVEQGIETSRLSQASLKFLDATRLEIEAETTVDRIFERRGPGQAEPGRGVQVSKGLVSADVSRQPSGRPFVMTTPHAELTVLGTRFDLSVTADATRVDVREGRVKLTRLSDNQSVEVAAGHFAIVGRGPKIELHLQVMAKDLRDGAGYAGTRDTQISGAEPARTFGTEVNVEADGNEVEGKRIYALLKWDLAEIPTHAVLRSAVITLFITDESQGSGYSFYEAKRPWIESEATWKLASAGVAWKTAGARSALDRGNEVLGTVMPRTKGETTILLTRAGENVLQGWIRNPGSNHGFVIANDNNPDGFKFASRESPSPERRPKLTLTYTLGAR